MDSLYVVLTPELKRRLRAERLAALRRGPLFSRLWSEYIEAKRMGNYVIADGRLEQMRAVCHSVANLI
jgi:hypothetical protein